MAQYEHVRPVLTRAEQLRYSGVFLLGFFVTICAIRMCDAALARGSANASEPYLQPLWMWLLTKWPWLLSHVAFGGVVGVCSFYISCFGFTILDVCHSSTKIQKDWFPSKWDMFYAALPQSIIYIGGNALGYIYGYHAIELPAQAPRIAVIFEQALLAFVVGDFLMYVEHRTMHTIPFLRQHIHSVHHAYHAPFSWAGGVVHPIEDIIVVLCQIAAPVILGHHPLSFWTFVFMWVALLIEEHSGHDVWWAPYNWLPFARCPCGSGGAPHDIHHYKVSKNYGFVLSVWDQLFNSAEAVVDPPDVPMYRHQTWWEFKKRGQKIH